jgi:hypothetical protein
VSGTFFGRVSSEGQSCLQPGAPSGVLFAPEPAKGAACQHPPWAQMTALPCHDGPESRDEPLDRVKAQDADSVETL